tara:strand:+ start:635 stop:1279 length:645 start_codon:yes stop_codon:yes gene_type:complete
MPSLRTSPTDLKTLELDASWPKELLDLKILEEAGIPVTETVVIPKTIEEEFFRLNNLENRLNHLLNSLHPTNLDEDDLEDVAAEAQPLIDSHYLLDEVIDNIYLSLDPIGNYIRIRLPGQNGEVKTRGRSSLMAVKSLWREAWSVKQIAHHVNNKGKIPNLAGPILCQAPDQIPAPQPLFEDVQEILGPNIDVQSIPGSGVSQIMRYTPSESDS